jgi:gas vesicle protein
MYLLQRIAVMRDHDDLPYIVIERHSAGVGAFVWGLLIGAGAALLLAPRSGAQTQEDIRDRVRRVRSAAVDRVDSAKYTVNRTRERVEDGVGAVKEQFGSVRDRISSRAEEARSAVESGRKSARDAIDRHVGDHLQSDGSASEASARDPGRMAASQARDVEIVVTDVTNESAEGRADLG